MNHKQNRYDRLSIGLHWLIAGAILALATIELLRGDLLGKETVLGQAAKAFHQPAGTIVFALILVRIMWRSFQVSPAPPVGGQPWEHRIAKLTHYGLYLLMVMIPLTGMAAVFARGRAIDFGLFQVSAPFGGMERGAARNIKHVHEFLGQAVLALAFVHAAAALWHHHVRGDDTLRRMLPSRRMRPAET